MAFRAALYRLRCPAIDFLLYASFDTAILSYTNLRSEWYNKGNDEGREEDLFWERESHEPLLIFQWKKSNVA